MPSGSRIQCLRTDKGGEHTKKEVENYCLQTGIMLEFASTSTPQQVGVSERDGKTLTGMVRCIPTGSGLPKFLWGVRMQTATYLANRAPHAALKNVTPHKDFHNKEANIEHVRVIGMRAFVRIERYKTKLDPHA